MSDAKTGGYDRDGLTQAEAQRRLAEHGPNVLESRRLRTPLQILFGALREPMFLLLVGAAGLYLVVGDLVEGAFLCLGAGLSIGLVVFQEARSERALAALNRLAQPFVRVIRDGSERRMPAADLVPGDLMLVGEGERLAADAAQVEGGVLTVDESALTGESAPVAKRPDPASDVAAADAAPGGEATPWLFAGSLVVAGQGAAVVARTGASTRLGAIGASLARIESEPTPLQKATTRIVGWAALAAVSFCVLVALAYGLLRSDWFGGALAGITIAISVIPEEFPMVLAIFLALGAWRLARRRVLVRRPAVIEALGAATLLCVDKTGTLTENRMAVAALWRDGALVEPEHGGALDEGQLRLLDAALMASATRPLDPMDRAVHALARAHARRPVEGEPEAIYPLRPDRLAFVQHWITPQGGRLAAKGAPEAIAGLCRLGEAADRSLHEAVRMLAERGLRVLAVASRDQDHAADDDLDGPVFQLEGLVGFLDPLRADVSSALAEAAQAGVQVAMITGDYPATALEIARQAGIDSSAGVITGAELSGLAPSAVQALLRRVRVFARIMPEQKLALVQAAKANGEVVAMTGDGVNDAPALEAAHIGIAMGQRGTDVAREAADIVLLDDRFASIVGGVRLGRRIHANLRKALTYVTAVHIPVAGLALAPILAGLPPLLYPLHVVLLELVIDPVCSIVFESEPSDRRVMQRPPRPKGEPLFGLRQALGGVVQGAVVLITVFATYALLLGRGTPEPQARAVTFSSLVIGNLALAFADSAEASTPLFDARRAVFWLVGAAASAVLAAALYLPPVSAVFRFERPEPGVLAAALAAAVVAGGWSGLVRRLRPDR